METPGAVQVGVRELKNRLTSYLKLAKANCEVIVTERGKPIVLIRALSRAGRQNTLEVRIAALAARGEVDPPARRPLARVRRVKLAGHLLSAEILANRR